jgi:beta-carotene ketolase (CrtW type)
VSCYFFGYHLEHHAYPYLPWWRLPAAREQTATAV